MTCYLTVLDVLGLHQAIMLRTGGEPALRDEALLESAVMRPQMAASPL
jgi:prophage maintenance system killer protein